MKPTHESTGYTRRDFLATAGSVATGTMVIHPFAAPGKAPTLNAERSWSRPERSTGDVLPLIPYPVKATATGEVFSLDRSTRIVATSSDARPLARWLQQRLAVPIGVELAIVNDARPAGTPAIELSLLATRDEDLGDEGYRLDVGRMGVRIQANAPPGVFYGLQTLLQLMPPAIEGRAHATMSEAWPIVGAKIFDYPRFAWRGLMLDVSRHFFDKEFIKSYLDEMARHKLNVFHWHLTDAPGWRLEIRSLPRLTKIGAWRAARVQGREWSERAYPTIEPAGPPVYGGYYAQDDVREIVAYARERFITIVPEIDVPGHSHALIASYPELSCPGLLRRAPDEERNVLCAGNERVFATLEKIIGEVADLFSGPFVHVGGDEVFQDNWSECPLCQARLHSEGLEDLNALQSYFMRRVGRIVEASGKRMIGWDEILEGELAPDAAVMSWRGQRGGLEAAQRGHPVVMTPSTHCYLDHGQGDPKIEPPFWGSVDSLITLETCFEFEPVPEGVDAQLILGGQGNLWTELVSQPRHAEYMTWPRALALAEVFWSKQERRPWRDFVARIEQTLPRFDLRDVKYARSAYQAIAVPSIEEDELRITLRVGVPDIELYYTFDGSNPDPFYPRYTEPIVVPLGAMQLRVAPCRKGQRVGEQLNVTISELEERAEQARQRREP